jgi:CO dehydrogenase/acetyl-CoA synthase gamma subunit (corrinoid Fe-S protein)
MKGLVVFYINQHPDAGQDVKATVDLFNQINREVIEKIQRECDYSVLMVPTTKESCRVEKIDFGQTEAQQCADDERQRAAAFAAFGEVK